MSTAQRDQLGRRERKKRATRDALEAAALELFEERGFDATTVEDITDTVDVARRTFFRHFDSKEAVLFADHDASKALLRQALAARPDGEPVLRGIRAALHDLAELQSADRDRQLVRARITLHAPSVQAHAARARDEWDALLAAWVAERLGCTPEDLRPALIAGATISGLRAALARWVLGDGTEDPHDLVDEALDLLEDGLGLGLERR